MCNTGPVTAQSATYAANEHTRLARLRELVGYRPKFQSLENEDCWACRLRVNRVVAMTKTLGGMPFLAPLCLLCYRDFQEMYMTELVAEALMGEDHAG